MKKLAVSFISLIATIIAGILIMGALTSCNKQIIDLEYSYNQAIIEGVGTIDIKNWDDYEGSDMVQVIGADGTVYLTHSSNVILMKK